MPALPVSVFQSDGALLLYGNRLSCDLPPGPLETNASFKAVVSFGNAFAYPPPSWVSPSIRDAAFLFVPSFQKWKVLCMYIFGGAAFCFCTVLWVTGGKFFVIMRPHYEGGSLPEGSEQMLDFLKLDARVMACLSLPGLLLLL